MTVAKKYMVKDEMLTLIEASAKYNIPKGTLFSRLKTTGKPLEFCIFNYTKKKENYTIGKTLRGWNKNINALLKKNNKKVYTAWCGIKDRCLNPNNKYYNDYGSRGISISEEFLSSFNTFLVYVGVPHSSNHSIDRIDNNKGYERGNLKWATPREQSNNRRIPWKLQDEINILEKKLGIFKKQIPKYSNKNPNHGATGTKEYDAWRNAKDRCYNPKNNRSKSYKGRGISMSKEFQEDFNVFLKHVGKAPNKESSLDRIDVNGDYTRGNLRWASKQVQSFNRRKVCDLSLRIEELKLQCDTKNISYGECK